MSDTAHLLRAAAEGDREAREELFAKHRARLLACLRVMMSAELARRVSPEDVLQETLLEAARKLDAFELQGPGSFYRWLVGIARFKAGEAQRAQAARKRALEAPLEHDPAQSRTSVSGLAMRTERAFRLREALGELPEAQATAVRLRYLEGASTAEAAARMGRSEAAVKMLVSRAFAALSTRLADGP